MVIRYICIYRLSYRIHYVDILSHVTERGIAYTGVEKIEIEVECDPVYDASFKQPTLLDDRSSGCEYLLNQDQISNIYLNL